MSTVTFSTLFVLALAAAVPHGPRHATSHKLAKPAAAAVAAPPAAAPEAEGMPAPAPPENFSYALVVTNNRSLNVSRPDLHYADDDGIKYAELFSEAFGLEHVTLLTGLDPESSRMYPAWQGRAHAPTRDNLDRALQVLVDRVEAHPGAQIFLVFAGHGDVEHGQGFVELEDSRLTAEALNSEVLSRLTHAHVNLILDSCNSYFMINPRKPGMQRWQAPAPVNKNLLDAYPNLGVVISTSAEAATYEWSELQSGIFSYELRSALRGAADANGDGKISYAEIEAFITVANQALANDLYRPKVFAQGPDHEQRKTLLGAFKGPVRTLSIAAAGAQRLTIRDHNGVRLLDANKEDGTALHLSIPADEPDMQVEQVEAPLPRTDRPRVLLRTLPLAPRHGAVALALDTLPGVAPNVLARGEAPVFSNLFATPFGRSAFGAFKDTSAADQAAYGVTAQDEHRLSLHLHMAADLQRDSRLLNGVLVYAPLLAAAGLTAATLGVNYTWQSNLGVGDQAILIGSLAVEVGLVTMGGFFTFRPDGMEHVRDEYDAMPKETETQRANAVLRTENNFYLQVRGVRTRRYVEGSIMSTLGTVLLAQQLYSRWFQPSDRGHVYLGLTLAVTSSLILDGLYVILLHRDPVERVWDLYMDQRDAFGGGMPPQPFSRPLQVSVAPYMFTDYPSSPTGLAFYVGGTF